MTIRTSEKTVSFKRPFVLGRLGEVLPAGDYRVETDEELLEGLSFPAYRRILTLIHLHSESDSPGLTRTAAIDPNDLDAALRRDAAPAETPSEREPSQKTIAIRRRSRKEKAALAAEGRCDDEGMMKHPKEQTDPAVAHRPLAILQVIEDLTADKR